MLLRSRSRPVRPGASHDSVYTLEAIVLIPLKLKYRVPKPKGHKSSGSSSMAKPKSIWAKLEESARRGRAPKKKREGHEDPRMVQAPQVPALSARGGAL